MLLDLVVTLAERAICLAEKFFAENAENPVDGSMQAFLLGWPTSLLNYDLYGLLNKAAHLYFRLLGKIQSLG